MDTTALKQLTAEAVAYVEAVQAREQELAAAAEYLSQESSAQAAFRDGILYGRNEERTKTIALIDFHLMQLENASMSCRALRALRRQLVEADR